MVFYLDPLKKLKEWDATSPKTESNALSHQMAALEAAVDRLRKFCQTLPKCNNAIDCDTCEIGDKIMDLDDWIAILGDLQQEWDPNLEEIDAEFVTELLTYYFKFYL